MHMQALTCDFSSADNPLSPSPVVTDACRWSLIILHKGPYEYHSPTCKLMPDMAPPFSLSHTLRPSREEQLTPAERWGAMQAVRTAAPCSKRDEERLWRIVEKFPARIATALAIIALRQTQSIRSEAAVLSQTLNALCSCPCPCRTHATLRRFALSISMAPGTTQPSSLGTPSKSVQAVSGTPSDGDVWIELFGTVKGLEEAVDLCMQAFGPDNPADKASQLLPCDCMGRWAVIMWHGVALHGYDRLDISFQVMSATTKKRLLIKAIQGLKQSRGDIQVGHIGAIYVTHL